MKPWNVTVWRALDWTLYGAVHGAVGDEVWRSVNVDVDVNLGVGRVVLEVVRGATGSPLNTPPFKASYVPLEAV